MNNALGVNQHVDRRFQNAEQPPGLDDFQPFVHHRRRVNGDFFPHRPIGVPQGLCGRHCRHFFPGGMEKRTTGGRQDDPFNVFRPGPLDTLENRTMFRVHRENPYAPFGGTVQNDLSGHHQGLLVGQRDIFSRFDRLQGRKKTGRTDHGGDDQIGIRQNRRFPISLLSKQNFRPGSGPQTFAKLTGMVFVHNGRQPRPEPFNLLLQQGDVSSRRQRLDAETMGMCRNDIQRTDTDRTG